MSAASHPIRRALISVSDKTGVIELGRFLAGLGIEVLSTGGTAKALAAAGVAVKEVSAHTGFPEIMDGRVKTLHPLVHGGILGRRDDSEHTQAMTWHGIGAIDLVAVNLYPFEATVAAGADFPTCIENIDIGGPALIRSAAKNHDFVTVLTDPADYAAVMDEMRLYSGATSRELRRHLAAEAFAWTAAYDAAIARWFQSQQGNGLPQRLVVAGTLKQRLRYGENPHQSAAFYVGGEVRPGVASATQLQGKELSYNNINDTDAAFELVAEFGPPAVAIIKHANPCGVALGADLAEAWAKARAADPVSAYGGIVAVNRPLDAATAAELGKLFLEVVIAPEVTAEARAVLGTKKSLRVLEAGGLPSPTAAGLMVRSVAGGFLAQGRDADTAGIAAPQVVSRRQPTAAEDADLRFAFTVVKHVKSNAIVLVRNGVTVGVGAGQMSRVDAARIAVAKAAEMAAAAGEPETRSRGSVVASDAFFPFADGLIVAAEAGATAAIHPGGSVRDQEVVAAADERGMAMIVTGLRHFRH